MCGIVGYVGSKSAAPLIVDGLRKLEYRGYDSAGIAIHDGKSIEIVRTLGKLAKLGEALEKRTLQGSTGIGHTRWATHGRPSEANAHPHSAGPIAVVPNGIIENHVALRQELEGAASSSSRTRTRRSSRTSSRASSRRACPRSSRPSSARSGASWARTGSPSSRAASPT